MAAKKKRMTQKEKDLNRAWKKEMQEKGILPPDKKRLNRRKFIEEVRDEWNAKDQDCYIWDADRESVRGLPAFRGDTGLFCLIPPNSRDVCTPPFIQTGNWIITAVVEGCVSVGQHFRLLLSRPVWSR